MPLMDISNPKIIIFLIENYEKEKRLRMNWIEKNKERIQEAATLQRKPTDYIETDIYAYNMKEGMAAITRDHVAAGYYRKRVPLRDGKDIPSIKDLKKGHSIPEIGLGTVEEDPRLARSDNDLSTDPIMRPVDKEIKAVLYKPKPEDGREQYLNKRSKILPEKRYYFPETTTWDYGWRLKDSKLGKKAEHGRCWHLTRTLKNRVGPQPDPPHYKSSDFGSVNKCTNS